MKRCRKSPPRAPGAPRARRRRVAGSRSHQPQLGRVDIALHLDRRDRRLGQRAVGGTASSRCCPSRSGCGCRRCDRCAYSTKPSPSRSPYWSIHSMARSTLGSRSRVELLVAQPAHGLDKEHHEERRRVDGAVIGRVRHQMRAGPSRRSASRAGSCPAPPRATRRPLALVRGQHAQSAARQIGLSISVARR